MKNLPEKIYLDLGFTPDMVTDFNDLKQVTWSKDNATGEGIEYVRKPAPSESVNPSPEQIAEEVYPCDSGVLSLDVSLDRKAFIVGYNYLLSFSRSQEDSVNSDMMDALKMAQILLAENLPSIRELGNTKLEKMTTSPSCNQSDYNAKASELHGENQYASNLLKKISTFITNTEKQTEK